MVVICQGVVLRAKWSSMVLALKTTHHCLIHMILVRSHGAYGTLFWSNARRRFGDISHSAGSIVNLSEYIISMVHVRIYSLSFYFSIVFLITYVYTFFYANNGNLLWTIVLLYNLYNEIKTIKYIND